VEWLFKSLMSYRYHAAQIDPALKRPGFVTSGPPALYSAMWKRVRLRAGAAAAAYHLIVRKEIFKGAALARRKKTLRPFAA